MPFSQFTTAMLDEGAVRVSGPFGFGPQERAMDVTCLHFLLVQGDEIVAGDGGAAGGDWDGTAAPAGNLKPGPVHAWAIAVLAIPGPPAAYETYSWADQIELTEAP